MIQLAGSNDTVSNLDGGNIDLLLTKLSIEGQIEFALLHSRLILVAGLHGVMTT